MNNLYSHTHYLVKITNWTGRIKPTPATIFLRKGVPVFDLRIQPV
jgi:hypothetical protein